MEIYLKSCLVPSVYLLSPYQKEIRAVTIVHYFYKIVNSKGVAGSGTAVLCLNAVLSANINGKKLVIRSFLLVY